jgi:hypothetical protein
MLLLRVAMYCNGLFFVKGFKKWGVVAADSFYRRRARHGGGRKGAGPWAPLPRSSPRSTPPSAPASTRVTSECPFLPFSSFFWPLLSLLFALFLLLFSRFVLLLALFLIRVSECKAIISELNNLVSEFNTLVFEYNTVVSEFNTHVSEFNTLVSEFNNLLRELNTLVSTAWCGRRSTRAAESSLAASKTSFPPQAQRPRYVNHTAMPFRFLSIYYLLLMLLWWS